MNILAVDATGDVLSVAIGVHELTRASKKHDEAILPLIERLLRSARLKWKDIDAIAAASGPGRFTGIRIGMSLAAAAGFQLGIPVFAISRLEAAAGKSKSLRVIGALPGWKGEIYSQVYQRGKAQGPAVWTSAEDWSAVRAGAETRGLEVVFGETMASDLIPIAARLLAAKKNPPFKPFYLKPAGYERFRS